MEILVLNKNFEAIQIIDNYESLIWTDRYNKCGDFELYISLDDGVIPDYIVPGNYLYIKESEHLMIMESYLIETDVEDGDHVTITGRSLESILERRIVWGKTTLSGSFQNGIETLLNNAIISPSIAERKIDNFIFVKSEDDRVTDLTIEAQYTGDNLYEIITNLCEERKIGFKILLNDSNQFEFSLYFGEDRSYNQTKNTYVIFSPNFDNILNSSYLESNKEEKNAAWVTGEEDANKNLKSVNIGTTSGLERREYYCSASDISSKKEDDTTISSAEYNNLLIQRGNEELAELSYIKSFEGEADTTRMYAYGKDFFIGDIVQVVNEYGKEGQPLISEMVFSYDKEGYSVYPTFNTNS